MGQELGPGRRSVILVDEVYHYPAQSPLLLDQCSQQHQFREHHRPLYPRGASRYTLSRHTQQENQQALLFKFNTSHHLLGDI